MSSCCWLSQIVILTVFASLGICNSYLYPIMHQASFNTPWKPLKWSLKMLTQINVDKCTTVRAASLAIVILSTRTKRDIVFLPTSPGPLGWRCVTRLENLKKKLMRKMCLYQWFETTTRRQANAQPTHIQGQNFKQVLCHLDIHQSRKSFCAWPFERM